MNTKRTDQPWQKNLIYGSWVLSLLLLSNVFLVEMYVLGSLCSLCFALIAIAYLIPLFIISKVIALHRNYKFFASVLLTGALYCITTVAFQECSDIVRVSICFFEVAASIFFAGYVMKWVNATRGLCFLFAFPIYLTVFHKTDIFFWIENDHILPFLSGAVSMGLSSCAIYRLARPSVFSESIGLLFAALWYFVWTIWNTSLCLISSHEIARGVALIFYTLCGVLALISQETLIRVAGWVTISGVIARLLLVEIWSMDIIPRIIAFLSVGALLILSGFIGRKKVPTAQDLSEKL